MINLHIHEAGPENWSNLIRIVFQSVAIKSTSSSFLEVLFPGLVAPDNSIMEATHHILIVDDDTDLREAMVLMFQKKKYAVHQAKSGKEAFQIVMSQKIDLVLSDVRMPNGNGVELLSWIRELHPEIPLVVLITGYTDFSEGDILAKGARAVLTKPFDRKSLLSKIKELLDSQGDHGKQ